MASKSVQEQTSATTNNLDRTKSWEVSPQLAPVDNVVFFLDHARIERSWTPDDPLAEGNHRIVILDIPGECNDNSLRVAVHGQAAVTSAQVRRRNEENTPLLAKLMSELGECRLNESLLVEDIQRLTTQMATWDRYVANIGVNSTPTDEAAATNLIRFLKSADTEHQRLGKELSKLREKKKEFDVALAADVEHVEYLKKCRDIVVEFCVEQPTKIAIAVSYTVPVAKWRPTYDIVVTPSNGRMKLVCIPVMHQWTAEDWTNVDVSLAVVSSLSKDAQSMAISGVVPDLAAPLEDHSRSLPNMLAQPAERMALRRNSDRQALPMITVDSASSGASKILEEVQNIGVYTPKPDAVRKRPLADGEQWFTPFIKTLGLMASLASTSTEPIAITSHSDELEAFVTYICWPNLSSDVQVSVGGINTTGAPILPANASCFVSGNFIGTTNLDHIPQLAPFLLWLGYDPKVQSRLTVPKNLTREQDPAESYSFGFEISNRHNVPLQLQVCWDVALTSLSLGNPILNVDGVQNEHEMSPLTYDIKQQVVKWVLRIPEKGTKSFELIIRTSRTRTSGHFGKTLVQRSMGVFSTDCDASEESISEGSRQNSPRLSSDSFGNGAVKSSPAISETSGYDPSKNNRAKWLYRKSKGLGIIS